MVGALFPIRTARNMADPDWIADSELEAMAARAERAHRMTCSDPDDPERVTPYSEIPRLIDALRDARE